MLPLNPKLLMLSAKHKASNQEGFVMVEVLVGLLLGVIFIGVAMQTMVLAASIRVRSQESSEAANWVKADLNIVTEQAKGLGGYNSTTGVYSNIDSTRCAATDGDDGYAQLLQSSADNNSDSTGADTEIGESNTDPKLSGIGNRPYTLRRETKTTDSAPHRLQVQYDVYRGTGTSTTPIYSFYAEVIPGVTFACKQI
jgi:type II secretory pathway pseudopilin PulG